MRFLTAMAVFFVMGCATHQAPPSGTQGTQAAQVDIVQKQKDDFDRLISQSVNVIGPKNLLDMVKLANGLSYKGLIVFHVVTTEEMVSREAALVNNEYAQALRERIEPGLNKVDVMKVRIGVQKLDDKSLVVFWAVISRVMLDQPSNPEFDAFFGAMER